MAINWEKIKRNPNKNHKVPGVEILNLKLKIESLEKNVSELTANRDELGSLLKKLEAELTEKKEDVASLEKKIDDLNGTLEKTKKDSDNALNELKNKLELELETKSEKISELEKSVSDKTGENENLSKTLSDRNNELSELNNKISELKNQMRDLPTLNNKIDNLEKEKSELNEKILQLNGKISELESFKSEKESEITNLQNQLTEKSSQVENLHQENEEKDSRISELNSKSEDLTNKITKLNNEIAELKEQIPKKPVYEKAEETIKGGPCPKCGFPTYEEYKYIEGEKQLIRKYCPNVSCGWRSAERPKIKITMTTDMPEEKQKELKVYQVKRQGLEEVTELNSKMVAIISDPMQDIIWIWKGVDSSRFDYAEATTQATKVKNEIEKLFHARIERVEEDNEPENFPKSLK